MFDELYSLQIILIKLGINNRIFNGFQKKRIKLLVNYTEMGIYKTISNKLS
jgi:hypothetical protein